MVSPCRLGGSGWPRPESSAVRAHAPNAFWAFADSWKAIFHSGVLDHSIKELARAREVLTPDGAVLLVEPLGADHVADNLHPLGRMYYSISVLACTPNAVSQRTDTSSEPLGAQAGDAELRALAAAAGFGTVRRLDVPAPMNLVLELRP